ncbi:50S ribosomal protein L29 [Candidatus Saccharibacteria bacterium]|nr:50S ribosomal protein L29 [Candidatus Saccharibacteria bacterium]
MKKLEDIRNKTPEQLAKKIAKLQEEIAVIHREKTNSKQTDVRAKINKRKEIARIKTVIREFELDKQNVEEDK